AARHRGDADRSGPLVEPDTHGRVAEGFEARADDEKGPGDQIAEHCGLSLSLRISSYDTPLAHARAVGAPCLRQRTLPAARRRRRAYRGSRAAARGLDL